MAKENDALVSLQPHYFAVMPVKSTGPVSKHAQLSTLVAHETG